MGKLILSYMVHRTFPVLLLDMVDNSTSPCELVSGWFSSHLTVQAGRFIL
jgi:hypothetical protein